MILGQVLTAGSGQAPARQAALGAGLSASVLTSSISRVCGSALEAVVHASRSIRVGDSHVVVAGGMESMSQAPHLLPRRRGSSVVMGDLILKDHMFFDGLTDAYEGKAMGCYGEECAREYDILREEQDAYALQSYERARSACEAGDFDDEIIAIKLPRSQGKNGGAEVKIDEEPFRVKDLSKLTQLRPLFVAPGQTGTVTAGNASTLNDGAAVVVLASEKAVEQYTHLTPLAELVGVSSYGVSPAQFPVAPVGCIKKLLKASKLSVVDMNLWEINEAFAVVPLIAQKVLGLDSAKVNIHGGAVSMGHPIGCSGARILVTLIHGLKKRRERYGVATLCIGGGEAVAVLVKNL